MNHGSTDNRLVQIAARTRKDPRIKVIHLSRNFGHHIASTAGLDFAKGNAVDVVDADLQQPFPVMHEMICRYCEGYDVVYATGQVRDGESWFKKLFY